MNKLFTARVGYKAQSVDEYVLDTTVKTGTSIYAPTWQMVLDVKKGVEKGGISWAEYDKQYRALMRKRYSENTAAFIEVLYQAHRHGKDIVLCCFCDDTSTTTCHCHRYILVDILLKVAAHWGYEFESGGEIK